MYCIPLVLWGAYTYFTVLFLRVDSIILQRPSLWLTRTSSETREASHLHVYEVPSSRTDPQDLVFSLLYFSTMKK